MNQVMYKVFNSRKAHSYMTVANDDDSSSVVTSSSTIGSESTRTLNGRSSSAENVASGETVITRMTDYGFKAASEGPDSMPPVLPFPPINGDLPSRSPIPFSNGGIVTTADPSNPNYQRFDGSNLVPAFDDMMKKYSRNMMTAGDLFTSSLTGVFENGHGGGGLLSNSGGMHTTNGFGRSDSGDPVLSGSRPGSSLQGSLFQADMSQFTSQTSLTSFSSSMYSMSSIYQVIKFNFVRHLLLPVSLI